MQINSYTDYSLRVLMQAALKSPARTTVEEVARTYGISKHLLVKIVHDLSRSGYLNTQRGIGGGFTLAMQSEKISISDIVHLGEGTDQVFSCKDKSGNVCRIFPECILKSALNEATQAFFNTLSKYSLADLVASPDKMRSRLGLTG